MQLISPQASTSLSLSLSLPLSVSLAVSDSTYLFFCSSDLLASVLEGEFMF